MASSIFHKFPQLPPEIQLKIWEASIRPPQAIPGGLHYIALDHMGNTVPLHNTWMDEPERRKSAYQLEEGLLTACWDSRTVVLKHRLEQDHFLSQHELRPISLHKALESQTWYPGRRTLLTFLPASETEKPIVLTKGLPSWNIELSNHEGYYPIKEFTASLAFLMRLVIQVAHTKHFRTPIIRLIDRNARWINDDSTQDTIETFYDCDDEYIEISMKTGSSSARIIQHSPVLKLLDHMGRLLEANFEILQHIGPRGFLNLPEFVIRDFVSIIALRRNQAGTRT
ncbi:uncharacterized protein BKA55DRAFT_697889 [Fusarium redolens]|uniref:2EXR domain-containing protein n=1 Tax=Fusarium redolens TaxID=48865 RepID=A0A9P9FVT0_FUSRE|nr:uncharacterized protein BKA55DRAFT_697889 [Fusarium redolens]KAH7213381.1 hypothetical protein BKA55DRAFT_697889 [Fusarium redolens]